MRPSLFDCRAVSNNVGRCRENGGLYGIFGEKVKDEDGKPRTETKPVKEGEAPLFLEETDAAYQKTDYGGEAHDPAACSGSLRDLHQVNYPGDKSPQEPGKRMRPDAVLSHRLPDINTVGNEHENDGKHAHRFFEGHCTHAGEAIVAVRRGNLWNLLLPFPPLAIEPMHTDPSTELTRMNHHFFSGSLTSLR